MKKRDDIYLREIDEQIQKIKKHIAKLTAKNFLASDLHKSAVVRELEVIGEAARMVSDETKVKFPEIPWKQITGMRNRLIHGYFDVDYSVVWEVATKELRALESKVARAILETAPPIHRWRLCPYGQSDVRRHTRNVKATPAHPGGKTDIRSFCRKNRSGKDQLYPDEIRRIKDIALASGEDLGAIGKLAVSRAYFPHGNDFDDVIRVWTRYWNDIFSSAVPLDPNIVKALVGSESSFNPAVRPVRIHKKNFARGAFQLSDETRKILADEKGEIHDHYLTLTAKDVVDPALAAAASIRWLFYKKERAGARLGRLATWNEAIAEYKGCLGKTSAKRILKAFDALLVELQSGVAK